MYNSILSPRTLFIIIWALVLSLLEMQLTNNIDLSNWIPFIPIYLLLTVCIIWSLVRFSIVYSKTGNINISKPAPLDDYKIESLKKYATYFFRGWAFLALLDFAYSGGFPLLRFVLGQPVDYANTGIPTIKGFEYTLYLLTISIVGYLWGKIELFPKWIVFLLCIFPVVMFSRATMMYGIIQFFISFLFFKKIRLKHFFYALVLILGIILLFGIIGDNRGEYANPFSYLITDKPDNPLNRLPSGFTWIYIYITCGYNNILVTYSNLHPTYELLSVFYNIIPGFLKQALSVKANSEMVFDESLNVSSFFSGYIEAFGIIGGIMGGFVLLFLAGLFYNKAKKKGGWYLIGYSTMSSCIILSPFFDALMTVSTVFQLIICLLLSVKFKFPKYENRK